MNITAAKPVFFTPIGLRGICGGFTGTCPKCRLRKTDSIVVTVIRTGVVLAMAWVVVFAAGKQQEVTG